MSGKVNKIEALVNDGFLIKMYMHLLNYILHDISNVSVGRFHYVCWGGGLHNLDVAGEGGLNI